MSVYGRTLPLLNPAAEKIPREELEPGIVLRWIEERKEAEALGEVRNVMELQAGEVEEWSDGSSDPI